MWQLYAYVANESTLRCKDDKKIAFLEGWKWTQTTNLIGFHQASIVKERPYQVININVFLLSETVGKKFNIFNHLPSVYLALINLDSSGQDYQVKMALKLLEIVVTENSYPIVGIDYRYRTDIENIHAYTMVLGMKRNKRNDFDWRLKPSGSRKTVSTLLKYQGSTMVLSIQFCL